MSLLESVAGISQQVLGGAAFDPETDITWHSLFYASGTAFTALGLSNGAAVGTWPNETGETDATEATLTPTFTASESGLNGQPAVSFDGINDRLSTAAFSTNPSYTSGVSIVAVVYLRATPPNVDRFICDSASGGRNVIYYRASNGDYKMFQGTGGYNATGALTFGAGYLMSALFTTGTSDSLYLDGALKGTAAAGTDTISNIRLGYSQSGGTTNLGIYGSIALLGIYEGDITADGNWSAFKTWAASHYGITIA